MDKHLIFGQIGENASKSVQYKVKKVNLSAKMGAKTILCMRKIADGGMYKPYAIISQAIFDAEVKNLPWIL